MLGKTTPYKTWMPDGLRRYWGADPRLHSRIGKVQGRAMQTTGKEGHLIYGPYERFEPGRYLLSIQGTAAHWTGKEVLDIACDHGKTVLLQLDLPKRDSGKWEHVLEVNIKSPDTDLEMRLFVAEETSLTVEKMGFQGASNE